MMQQINLYRPEFSSSVAAPNIQHALIACIAIITLLVIVFCTQLVHMHRLDTKISETEANIDRVMGMMAGIDSGNSNNETQTVDQKIERLKARLLNLREITSVLLNQSGTRINQHGFSQQMDGLVRQHVEGISLLNMKLFNGGHSLALQGSATLPEKTPHYLSALQTDAAFKDVEFGQLQMRRNQGNGQIDFSLQHDNADNQP